MNDQALLIPTRLGLLGGIVTEPDGPASLSVVILPGRGGDRSGVNQMWTRTARALAAMGAVVFRPDYPGRGDGIGLPHSANDVESAARDALAWFDQRWAGRPVVFIGECYGARLAIALADGTAGLGGVVMVAPSLYGTTGGGFIARAMRRALRVSPIGGKGRIHRPLRRGMAGVLHRAPIVALVGDRDTMCADLVRLAVTAETGVRTLDVDVVPGVALHGHRTLALQGESRRRIVALVTSMAPNRNGAGESAAPIASSRTSP